MQYSSWRVTGHLGSARTTGIWEHDMQCLQILAGQD